ncbi:MAG: hypothetical protein H0V79_02620 [Actinobacteria bacterium]|nr:hypothetical protein [Actinomycetota bacterium]
MGSKFSLLGIDDVEAFCARVVEKRRLDWLDYHEREALIVYLVEVTWELSERFQPRGYPFSQWLRSTLERRCIDWLRKEFGRTKSQFSDGSYERKPTEFVSFDADDSEHDLLGAALGGGSVDDGEHRLADQLRSLDARGRRRGRRDDGMG